MRINARVARLSRELRKRAALAASTERDATLQSHENELGGAERVQLAALIIILVYQVHTMRGQLHASM